MDDLISRQAAIDAADKIIERDTSGNNDVVKAMTAWKTYIEALPSAQPVDKDTNVPITDTISRQAAIDAIKTSRYLVDAMEKVIKLPSAQPERDTPKRVLWTGWKGHRYTRYNCPSCKKPVRNDDVYCHRCGQRLMFPKVSHTPYVEGQKQEVIVRWDDE